jgi:branched chain amino acid efflux pump
VSWTAIGALAVGCYALKLVGPLLLTGREPPERLRATVDLLALPLLAALVAVQTFAAGHELVLDARVAGLAAAALLVWRRAPFLLVVLAGAAATAAVRAVV